MNKHESNHYVDEERQIERSDSCFTFRERKIHELSYTHQSSSLNISKLLFYLPYLELVHCKNKMKIYNQINLQRTRYATTLLITTSKGDIDINLEPIFPLFGFSSPQSSLLFLQWLIFDETGHLQISVTEKTLNLGTKCII